MGKADNVETDLQPQNMLKNYVPTLAIEEKNGYPVDKLAIYEYPISTLAWLGDAVYELEIRLALARQKDAPAGSLNQRAINLVCASGQAKILEILLNNEKSYSLSEAEKRLVNRARNYHSKSVSKVSSPSDYRAATALEALLGAHVLLGNAERIAELITFALSELESTDINCSEKENSNVPQRFNRLRSKLKKGK